jgi:uncharacterized membrane protein HdeD (DUF308 family)
MSSSYLSSTVTVPDPETRALPTAAYVINGLATLALGIMILAWPEATLAVVAALFGIHLLFIGVVQVYGALRSPASGAVRVLLGFLGAVAAVAGVICIISPFTSLKVLVILTAIGWFAQALADAVAGTRAEGVRRWFLWGLALIAVVGALVLVTWPEISLLVIVRIAGWTLVVLGIAQLVTLAVRRSKEA